MPRTILTSVSPNAEWDDVLLAVGIFFQPWTWRMGTAVVELEAKFQKLFSQDAVAYNSGRSCLHAILLALDLKSDDEVLLQAFTCVAVPGPVLWAGARPIYVDCDPETFTMDPADLERKITSKSKVLIVQHTFGRAADMGRLMEIAKKHGLFVIEDCAHALGGRLNGKLLGSFGDVGFFSFGRDKVLSSIFGGMVVAKDRTFAERLRQAEQKRPVSSHAWIAQQLSHPIIMSIAKRTYDWFGFGKIVIEISKRLHLISKAVLPIEKRGGEPGFVGHRMSNALAELASHQMEKLDMFNQHRREIVSLYEEGLKDLVEVKGETGDDERVWLRYSITTKRRTDLMKAARQSRIHLGDWYDVSIAPPGVVSSAVSYDSTSCPNAERLAMQILNLPTHIRITPDDAKRIIFVIKAICH